MVSSCVDSFWQEYYIGVDLHLLLLFFLAVLFFFNLFFIYLLLAVLGLRFCARAFSSCGKRGPLFIAVRGPLTIVASLVVEHRLQTRRLSSCGSRAQLPRGTWDLPRPGLEPVSPALAGRLSTTAPPGKPYTYFCITSGEICLFTPLLSKLCDHLFNVLTIRFPHFKDVHFHL